MSQAVSQGRMSAFRAAAAARHRHVLQRRDDHWRRAQDVARQAARILRGEFSAHRVVLFGSATCRQRFHPTSDVDLAVWGLDEGVYLKAVARLLDVDPRVPVDLVLAPNASAALRAAIDREGRAL